MLNRTPPVLPVFIQQRNHLFAVFAWCGSSNVPSLFRLQKKWFQKHLQIYMRANHNPIMPQMEREIAWLSETISPPSPRALSMFLRAAGRDV